MNIGNLYQRTSNILLNPFETWKEIKTERKSKNELVSQFLLPISITVGICSLFGTLFFSKIGDSFSIGYVIFNGIISFLVLFLEVYFSALLISEIATSFSPETDSDSAFSLVIYAQTPLYVSLAVVKLFPQLLFLIVLSIYTIYLFWIGSLKLLKVPEDKRIIFLMLSMLVIIIIFLLLSLIFDSLYNMVLFHLTKLDR